MDDPYVRVLHTDPDAHELRQYRPPLAAMPQTAARSAMSRALDEQPPRPYVYRGTGADLLYEETMPDLGPDPEWYRELAEEGLR